MKKYKVEVTRKDSYEIEIDETIWTEEQIEHWSSIFFAAADTEDVANLLAMQLSKHGCDARAIEGFGLVDRLSDADRPKVLMGSDSPPPSKFTSGLAVRVISEGRNFETETTEV